MSAKPLEIARARIADCLQVDGEGRLVQRRDYLNLSGLGLDEAALTTPFDPQERGLPEISLADLPYLRYLDLTGNRLEALPECVTGFTGLVWLGLNFNRLKALPESIGALVNLQRLYLRGNALTALPESLGNLRSLVELDLTGCRIATLPAALTRLEALEHLALEEEALAPDLRAACKERGWVSLRAYLARAAVEAKVTQCVGKVVVAGSQENGKTCLQRALRGEPFIEGYRSTDGMSRERLHLGLDGTLVSPQERRRSPGPRPDVIDLTLWDMGGQEHYQHTHQMFFTPAAVYLLVTLPRQGGSVQELDRWIELIKRRTENKATIIVVSTWCWKYPPDRAVTLAELRAKHGEVIRAVVAVDSEDGTGIPELRRLLAEVAQEERTQCRHTWLPGWAGVLNDLAAVPRPFLRWPEVAQICARHGIEEAADQRQVIRTGHYIGALLWREDIPAGEDVVILNPDWLSRAVARLLDDEETRKAHGLVEIEKLDRVWRGPGRDGTPGYEPDTYPALIELMEINELAYRPREPGKKVGEGRLLLVTQMVEDRPPPDMEATWQAISPKDGVETTRVIAFRPVQGIGYVEVPDLIWLLIFRLREFSLGRADYRKAVHWQRGLLVSDDYGSAGKIERDGPLLRITVRHRLGDGLMHSIVHRIGFRDDGFWTGRGLEKVEFAPCPPACPNNTAGQGLISVADCVEADRAGNQSVRCEQCRKYVPIREVLGVRVPMPSAQQEVLARIDTMERNVVEVIRMESQATRETIGELSKLVRMQGDAILDAFASESKDGPRLFSLIPLPGSGWNPRTWTELRFRVVIWCEASRRPVPLFRERKPDKPDEWRGSEVISLTRDWVQAARRVLKWSSWAALTLVGGGVGALGGLVTATGGVLDTADAENWGAELDRQQRALKEVAEAIRDEAGHPLRGVAAEAGAEQRVEEFGSIHSIGFGKPVEQDLKLIRFLREEFKKKDPTWGGLEPRDDGKFGRIWAHPKSPLPE